MNNWTTWSALLQRSGLVSETARRAGCTPGASRGPGYITCHVTLLGASCITWHWVPGVVSHWVWVREALRHTGYVKRCVTLGTSSVASHWVRQALRHTGYVKHCVTLGTLSVVLHWVRHALQCIGYVMPHWVWVRHASRHTGHVTSHRVRRVTMGTSAVVPVVPRVTYIALVALCSVAQGASFIACLRCNAPPVHLHRHGMHQRWNASCIQLHGRSMESSSACLRTRTRIQGCGEQRSARCIVGAWIRGFVENTFVGGGVGACVRLRVRVCWRGLHVGCGNESVDKENFLCLH